MGRRFPLAGVSRVAETILPNRTSRVKRDAVAEDAIIVNGDIGIDDAVLADFRARANEGVGVNDAVFPNGCSGIDVKRRG